MPSITLDGKGLEFFYTDSGVPYKADEYTTLVIIHGHGFHSGTFQRLNPLAPLRSLRLICINRRGYPGSTPYTPSDMTAFRESSESERTDILAQQGMDLAVLVDALIQKCGLEVGRGKGKGGAVALVAWSMGNTFLMALMASIIHLPGEIRERLQRYVKTIIMWEPPSHCLGIPSPQNSYNPFRDPSIPRETKGAAFAHWVSSYYTHPEFSSLSTHSVSSLNQNTPDPSRRPSIDTMDLQTIASLDAGEREKRLDIVMSESRFVTVLAVMKGRALFDCDGGGVRKAWEGTKVWHLCGFQSTWNIHYAMWILEKEDKELQERVNSDLWIHFKAMEGNHFVMWDEPEKAMDALEECIRS